MHATATEPALLAAEFGCEQPPVLCPSVTLYGLSRLFKFAGARLYVRVSDGVFAGSRYYYGVFRIDSAGRTVRSGRLPGMDAGREELSEEV
jgi:hypothetical protein